MKSLTRFKAMPGVPEKVGNCGVSVCVRSTTLLKPGKLCACASPDAHIVASAREHFTADNRFQIDILINNAGIARNALLPKVTVEDFESTYRVNVLGPLLVVQAAQPYLPTDRSGRIVNISSVSSSTGFVTQSVYGGTKAAVEAMTRTWARELAENATVNAVNPGVVVTELHKASKAVPDYGAFLARSKETHPLGFVGEPKDVAELVLFLVSDRARWITGACFPLDGGRALTSLR